MEPEIEIEDEPFRLDHFLKSHSIAESGGHAKHLIQNGLVKVNGQIETRRRRKLAASDVVEANGKKFVVESSPSV